MHMGRALQRHWPCAGTCLARMRPWVGVALVGPPTCGLVSVVAKWLRQRRRPKRPQVLGSPSLPRREAGTRCLNRSSSQLRLQEGGQPQVSGGSLIQHPAELQPDAACLCSPDCPRASCAHTQAPCMLAGPTDQSPACAGRKGCAGGPGQAARPPSQPGCPSFGSAASRSLVSCEHSRPGRSSQELAPLVLTTTGNTLIFNPNLSPTC